MDCLPENNNDEIILIADDNELTSQFIQTLLEDSGFSCVTAYNGLKTLQIVQSQRVDLVLLDIVMPDMNGFAIASQIKLLVKEFLPIIMVTALCSVDDKITGLTYADDYITKPFSADELIARIKSLLRSRRHLRRPGFAVCLPDPDPDALFAFPHHARTRASSWSGPCRD